MAKPWMLWIGATLLLSPVVAEAATTPTAYGLVKRPGGGDDELFSYDLTQDVFSSGGYNSTTLAPLIESPFSGDSVTAIAVGGNTLYGLVKRPGGGDDELFSYDLTQDVFSSGGYRSDTLAPLIESPFSGDSVTAIAVGGNTLYALVKRPGGGDDELFSYDLTQDVFSSGGYRSTTLAPLHESPFDGDSITAIAISPASTATAVPEPATWALTICGFGLIGLTSRRKSRSQGIMLGL